MTIREKIRASLIGGTFYATAVNRDYIQRSKASCGASCRFSPDVRSKVLIYGSRLKLRASRPKSATCEFLIGGFPGTCRSRHAPPPACIIFHFTV